MNEKFTTKTAVIYARYSSASQTDQSIEGQLHVCNQYAKANNLLVVDTYIDKAMTGTNDNRASFQRMLKDSETAKWDVVLVYALDRFGRNAIEVSVNKLKLKNNKKVLLSATQRTSDNIDGTKNLDGILLENVYIGIAEYYSAELSQKVIRGMNENRKKGLFCGGKPPYGYYVQDKRVYIDEVKAQGVKLMFEQYALGVTVAEIIQMLHAKGLFIRGKPFTDTTIRAMLHNKKYMGIWHVHGEDFPNVFPAIVSKKLWESVQKLLADNYCCGRYPIANYLLRRKAICGYCGKPISAECGTGARKTQYHYYSCAGKKKFKNNCQNKAIRKELLEELVLDNILTFLTKDEYLNQVIQLVYQGQISLQEDTTTLQVLEKELRQVQFSIDNIMKAIENGIYTSTTAERLTELENKKQELIQSIRLEKGRKLNILSEEEIRQFYQLALQKEGAILIRYLIKQVVVYNDKIEIQYNNPTTKGPDDKNQGFFFYDKTVTVQVYNTIKGCYQPTTKQVLASICL